MNATEFYNNVIQWAKDRKLIPNATAFAQRNKSFEEALELHTAVLKNDTALFRDSVGDVLVTLIIGEHLVKGDNVQLNKLEKQVVTVELDYNEYVKYNREILTDLERLVDHLFIEIGSRNYVRAAQSCITLALAHPDVTLEECLEQAWNDIKDRTGEMGEDGIYYKNVLCANCMNVFLDRPRGRKCPECN